MSDCCPSCGEAWQGACPNDPWYVVYECQECGRVEDECGGRVNVIREGKELSQAQWKEVARLKVAWAQQEEGEGDE